MVDGGEDAWCGNLVGLARHDDIVKEQFYVFCRKLEDIVRVERRLISTEGIVLPCVADVEVAVVNRSLIVVAQCDADDTTLPGLQRTGTEGKDDVAAEVHLWRTDKSATLLVIRVEVHADGASLACLIDGVACPATHTHHIFGQRVVDSASTQHRTIGGGVGASRP